MLTFIGAELSPRLRSYGWGSHLYRAAEEVNRLERRLTGCEEVDSRLSPRAPSAEQEFILAEN